MQKVQLACLLFPILPALFVAHPAHAAPALRHTLRLAAGGPVAMVPAGSLQFFGSTTVLIRYQGMTILTDPDLLHQGEWTRSGYGLTSTRPGNAAFASAALAPIDLIILPHFHEGHGERLAQQKLDRNIPIVTSDAAAIVLRGLGFKQLFPMRTWDAMQVSKGTARLRLTSMPGRQDTAAGTMLDFGGNGAAYRIYISGDTLVHGDIEDIPRRFPGADLALLRLGASRLLGVVTRDGADGFAMLKLMAPEHLLAVQGKVDDGFKSAAADFEQAAGAAGLTGKISYFKQGASYPFALK